MNLQITDLPASIKAGLAMLLRVFETAITSETARQIADGFRWVMTSPRRHQARAVVVGWVVAVTLMAIGSANVAASIPSEPPVTVARVGKDQSRLPQIDPVLARAIFPQPRKLVCDDCPIKPRPVQTISIPKPEEVRTGSDGKSKAKAKGKRSDAGAGGMQLASLGSVDNEPPFVDATAPVRAATDLKTESATLKTPFGTTIKTRVSLAGIPNELTGFLRKVQSECGTVTVISGFRYSGVPGTCHAKHQALDYQIGNPSCALQVARGFRGGHSNDYFGVQAISRGMPAHFHVSICGHEMGVRFAHRGSSSSARSHYAKRGARRSVRSARVGKRVRYARR